MSDGKRSNKQDIVIVSIKPRRPEYPLNKTHVLVKELHLEWDKLDAYYRGQILKLKTHAKSQTRSHKSRKSSRSSSKKSSSISRRATSGNQLTELFGDENIPLSDNEDLEISDDDTENLILSNKRDIRKDRSRKKCKLDAALKQDNDDKNYLSIPRVKNFENFRIEFEITLKTRTPVHTKDHSDNSGYISPIKVEPYKPPVAIGFNGVHIQKILYHKTEGGVNYTSPTTTALTPDKPQDNESASPLFIRNESKVEKSSDICNGTVFKNNNRMSSENKGSFKLANKDKSSITLVPIKRKFGQPDNGPVSSTTTASEDVLETQPKKRKDKTIKDKIALTLPPGKDKLIKSQCSTKSLSITDKIIKKAKQLPPEMKERQRQRLLESQKRKTYASTIGDQQQVMDSVDAALKAFEMIWAGRPLSPIRSP